MKKKIFIWVFALAMILPSAIILSACGGKKKTPQITETGINIYIDEKEVTNEFNTIEIFYGDYENTAEMISTKLSVIVNYSDNTSSNVVYGDGGFTVSGLPQNLNANEQGYNLTLNYKNFNENLKLIIHKATIDFQYVGWSYDDSYPFTYDGDEKIVELVNVPENVKVTYENNIKTNAGTYNATAIIEYDESNYNIINDEDLILSQQWTINKAQIDMWSVNWDYSTSQPYTYDGTQKEVKLMNLPEVITVSYENNTATNSGNYSAIATLNYDTANYELINKNFDDTINWEINKQKVNTPTQKGGRLFYNGQKQSGVNYNIEDSNNLFTVNGTISSTNAGQYSVTFTLIDTTNYEWDDSTINNIIIEWEIEKVPLYFSGTSWDYNSYEPFIYDGQEKTVSVINLPEGVTIKNYTGTISATNAGTYSAGVEFNYDDVNYYLSGEPQELQWKIEKAENTISGEIVLDSITYGETFNGPSGLSALYGEITYKYYNEQYEEILEPTNAGSYYVAGHSVGDNNWISEMSEYKSFTIDVVELPFDLISSPSIKLEKNSFIYTGSEFTPNILQRPDESLVNISGDLTKTEIGNYTITLELIDKTNYRWKRTDGRSAENQTLTWSIIDSPLTMTLNNNVLSASEFEALTQFNIGDNWYVTVNGEYNYNLNYEYVNKNNIKVWSGDTDEGSNSNLDVTIDPSHLTYVIKITQNAEVVYTKTITVNHDIFENVMVGEVAMTFDEFVANPEVEYGKNLKFNLKTEYLDTFNFSQNNFTVTNNTTVTMTYQILDTRVYKTINVVCVFDPIENITINSQTLSYEEFIANPLVKYGDELSINFKSNYDGFYTHFSFPYIVKDDVEITIYTPTGETFETINVNCRINVLSNILIDGESVSYEEFLQMESIHLGSTLTFTVNEEFADIIQVSTYNNGQKVVLTGQQSYTFNEVGSWQLYIREKDTQNYIDDIYLTVVLFDSIGINDNIVDTSSSTYVEYSRDLGESTFEISFDSNLLDKYDLYYEMNSSKIKLTQSTFEVLIDENEEYAYAYIYAYINDDYQPVLTIHFNDFCPVELVTAQIYKQHDIDVPQFYVNNNYTEINSNGAIIDLDIEFKDNYVNCTYKIFDESGLEVQDFTTIQNENYTAKIYLNDNEIYSFLIKVKYQFNDLIDGMQYLGNSNITSIVTNSSQLTIPNLTDTEYFTNQNITFDDSNSVELNEGQQIIQVVYTFNVNQKTYSYSFDLIAEYIPENEKPTQYVSNININYYDEWGNPYEVSFDNNLQYSDGSYSLSEIAFIEENNIEITSNYTVTSKEIKFSEDKTVCWLEYVISVDGQNKTFRAYIKTYGTISNNTNAQIIFSDAKTELDITGLLVDNTYTIEKVNVFGDIDIILEDENAKIEYYFNNEIVDRNDFELNSVGTYMIKIISSDNTETRSITIIVENYESLMFEVFYEQERLYMQHSSNGLLGNMKMRYNPLTGPYFIGYFGETNLDDLTQVSISGNTAYENMLYYSDKLTPITNLNNLVLNIMTDTDGSISEIIGAKYVMVYAKIENVYYAVYFIFENRPPYPMTFSFDTDNNDVINENDKQISLKVNLEEIETGAVDLGDFIIGNNGPSIEVTREELGMAEDATSVNTTINWLSTFEDYSYQCFIDLPEGQEMPELIGPSEENLSSTINLNFVDNGSGVYVATIYICTEGATLENIYDYIIPVEFVLVN